MFDQPVTDRVDPDDYHTDGAEIGTDRIGQLEADAEHNPDRYTGEETTEGVEEALARL